MIAIGSLVTIAETGRGLNRCLGLGLSSLLGYTVFKDTLVSFFTGSGSVLAYLLEV